MCVLGGLLNLNKPDYKIILCVCLYVGGIWPVWVVPVCVPCVSNCVIIRNKHIFYISREDLKPNARFSLAWFDPSALIWCAQFWRRSLSPDCSGNGSCGTQRISFFKMSAGTTFSSELHLTVGSLCRRKWWEVCLAFAWTIVLVSCVLLLVP